MDWRVKGNRADAGRERDFRQVRGQQGPAARVAMLDRGGLSGPADTVIAGPESAVLRELGQFRDAGATDLIISPVGAPQDVRRTLELTGALARAEGGAIVL